MSEGGNRNHVSHIDAIKLNRKDPKRSIKHIFVPPYFHAFNRSNLLFKKVTFQEFYFYVPFKFSPYSWYKFNLDLYHMNSDRGI